MRRRDPRLRRSMSRRRSHEKRKNPLPQALHHQTDPPNPDSSNNFSDRLTNIEASLIVCRFLSGESSTMPKKYPDEVREGAVRMALDRLNEYPTPYAACQALAPQLNVGVETLQKWVIQAQVDAGTRRGRPASSWSKSSS